MWDLPSLLEPPHTILFPMASNATYPLRSGLWHSRRSLPPADPLDTRDGTLTIEQQKSRRPRSASLESDQYAVEELQPEPGVMGRQFWMVNQSDTEPEVYKTTIGPRSFCTCKASVAGRVRCKHVDALTAIIAAGGLPQRLLRPEGGL